MIAVPHRMAEDCLTSLRPFTKDLKEGVAKIEGCNLRGERDGQGSANGPVSLQETLKKYHMPQQLRRTPRMRLTCYSLTVLYFGV